MSGSISSALQAVIGRERPRRRKPGATGPGAQAGSRWAENPVRCGSAASGRSSIEGIA